MCMICMYGCMYVCARAARLVGGGQTNVVHGGEGFSPAPLPSPPCRAASPAATLSRHRRGRTPFTASVRWLLLHRQSLDGASGPIANHHPYWPGANVHNKLPDSIAHEVIWYVDNAARFRFCALDMTAVAGGLSTACPAQEGEKARKVGTTTAAVLTASGGRGIFHVTSVPQFPLCYKDMPKAPTHAAHRIELNLGRYGIYHHACCIGGKTI
ncbi:hypothetical protein P153DRAFT_202654 [Dothidotthia symphoricarpi CBS 119687]|uniref:Uncharacterized protein n=1 Tax=Dothidotthia symphoricarpi CBS 119687 TaxID=1392245 RepID=A0A6A6AII4_9PLEO|nr:uncharacterized protein P153DRAFT_202654 [Dothidotthia symphoricarpi CBS 119687]KAF2131769.1 hypothetical protein P153DRAFT_202654 [Dothidotthia symphoricarpi CBS 119687]